MRTAGIIIGALFALQLSASAILGADSLSHPILSISPNNGSAANTVLSTWTEAQYTNDFTPRYAPRNEGDGFAPAVVAGDSGWSWSSSSPTQLVSLPSGTVFPNPNAALYPVQTQAVTTFTGDTISAPYYLKAGSTSSKSMVFNVIAYHQQDKRDSDLANLAGAYIGSGSNPATRNGAYARRIAIALLDWARWYPDYTLTGKNSPTFIDTSPAYILPSDLQRASDHNGLAHEWNDTPLKAFDAIYDSVALTNLSAELGFDVRDYIANNIFFFEGDFFENHVPVSVAIGSNLSGPYEVLPEVARVLDRPDYIVWMDQYLNATVTDKIRRDGALEEGMGYSIGYLNANVNAAQNTWDYFLTRPATNSMLIAISNRASLYIDTLKYGQAQWATLALPNGQLPSFGDTPFNTYFSARNNGNSALLPAYGTVALGAGSGSQAVQVNQNFAGNNNHMRSDTTAFTLWAFGNEYLGNIRYYHCAGRQFDEQMLAHNTVTIDRVNEIFPSADTYGNGNLTLYEPGTNGLAVTEIDGQRDYANRASRYQRLLLLNTEDLERPYLVDVFRVTGGTNHDYVLHGAVRWDQNWQCSFPLVTNSNPYPMLEPGETWVEPTSEGSSFPYYGYWRDVSSNTAPGNFYITYRDTNRSLGRDTRLWMTADPNTCNVYLGMTPNPGRDNTTPSNFYVYWRPSAIIRHRVASGPLQDLFVSVVEPMNGGVSNIVSVERLPMSGNPLESCGLRIVFKDGRVDTYIVNLRNPKVAGASTGSATVGTADGQYSLTGRIGLYSTNATGAAVWVVNGSHFQYPDGSYAPTNLDYSGGIAGVTRRADGAAWDAFTTTTPLPTGTVLRGKYLALTHGALAGSGTTNISEMYRIDQVVLNNGLYYICFTNDPFLEIDKALLIDGGGSDIWGTSDQFNYDFQSVSGDLALNARVLSQDNTSSWAKSGVMIRETTAANAGYVGLYVTPGNGVSMQYRDGTGSSAVDLARQTGVAAPYWVRLVRSGSTFTGYSSPDGVTWTQVGQINVVMATGVTAGLAVCAHDNSALNTSAFDNISLAGPLSDTDIGAVGLSGSTNSDTLSVEQVAPLRTFTGSNTFEIALSASQPASVPGVPGNLTAVGANTQVALNWDPVFGASSYNVKRASIHGGSYSTIAGVSGTTYTDSGLTNGVTYFYVISAVNNVGEGMNSAEANATPTAYAPPGLVARLTFDDGTAEDVSGNGNNGVLVNGATIVNDPERGKVLSLDGVNQYVDLGNAPSLDLSGGGQATITAWVNVADTHNHNSILTKGEWKDAYSLLIKGDTSPPNLLWTGNDTSVFSGAPVPLNTWTHVAVTINGSLTTFYIDGQLSGATNQDRGNAIDNTGADVCIGREQYSGSLPAGRWFFNGELDDVRIYKVALTQADIQNIMANGLDAPPAFTSDPIAEPPATVGQAYSGSIAAAATDPNPGDALVFSKISGPAWLNVANDGALSGTPDSSDLGTNSFGVRVADPGGLSDDSVLNIVVDGAAPILSAITADGASLRLTWTGGVSPYQVQMKTNLNETAWADLGGLISTNVFTITPTNTAAFYRILGQ